MNIYFFDIIFYLDAHNSVGIINLTYQTVSISYQNSSDNNGTSYGLIGVPLYVFLWFLDTYTASDFI